MTKFEYELNEFLKERGLVIRVCDGGLTICDGDCENCEGEYEGDDD